MSDASRVGNEEGAKAPSSKTAGAGCFTKLRFTEL